MRSRLTKVLERDNYICGLHTRGCGKKIDPLNDNPTLDHIIPLSFTKTLENAPLFRKIWNYQPMCGKCNAKKGGQVRGLFQFQCVCHHWYVEENGDVFLWHKLKEGWKRVFFTKNLQAATFKVVPAKFPGKGGAERGLSLIKGREFGHIISGFHPFNRILTNAQELFRTGRFGKCGEECKKFEERCIIDNGSSLELEVGEKLLIAKKGFYFFSIVSSLYVRKGIREGSLLLTRDCYGKRIILDEELRNRILLIDINKFDTILDLLTGEIKSHTQWLIKIGILKVRTSIPWSRLKVVAD